MSCNSKDNGGSSSRRRRCSTQAVTSNSCGYTVDGAQICMHMHRCKGRITRRMMRGGVTTRIRSGRAAPKKNLHEITQHSRTHCTHGPPTVRVHLSRSDMDDGLTRRVYYGSNKLQTPSTHGYGYLSANSQARIISSKLFSLDRSPCRGGTTQNAA